MQQKNLVIPAARLHRFRRYDENVTMGEEFIRFMRLERFEKDFPKLLGELRACLTKREIVDVLGRHGCRSIQC